MYFDTILKNSIYSGREMKDKKKPCVKPEGRLVDILKDVAGLLMPMVVCRQHKKK